MFDVEIDVDPPSPPADCSGEPITGLPVRSMSGAEVDGGRSPPAPGLIEMVSDEPGDVRSSCFSLRLEFFIFVEPTAPPRGDAVPLEEEENCSAFFSERSLSRCSLDEPVLPPPPVEDEGPPSDDDFEPGEFPLAVADLRADMLGFPPPVELPPECSGCFGDADEVAPVPCFGL